jgi:hypothetical protein
MIIKTSLEQTFSLHQVFSARCSDRLVAALDFMKLNFGRKISLTNIESSKYLYIMCIYIYIYVYIVYVYGHNFIPKLETYKYIFLLINISDVMTLQKTLYPIYKLILEHDDFLEFLSNCFVKLDPGFQATLCTYLTQKRWKILPPVFRFLYKCCLISKVVC